MSSGWYRVVLPYACYGLRFGTLSHRVTDFAPIARWMEGQHIDNIRSWVERKGGTIEELEL